MQKINLDFLDKEELESVKNFLQLKNIISSEIESQAEESKIKKEIKSSRKTRALLTNVLLEMRRQTEKEKNTKPKAKRDASSKKLELCLDEDSIYVVSNNVARRSISPICANDNNNDEEDSLLEKLVEMLKPLIRQMVHDEVKKCIVDLVKS